MEKNEWRKRMIVNKYGVYGNMRAYIKAENGDSVRRSLPVTCLKMA